MGRYRFIVSEMFKAITEYGTGRALTKIFCKCGAGIREISLLISIKLWMTVPMVADQDAMMVQPLWMLFEQLKQKMRWSKGNLPFSTRTKLDQSGVQNLSQNQKLILVCGRYEGIMNA